jgi:hypothetical protein
VHTITIQKDKTGRFSVLLNGHYIHRNLDRNRAVEVASEAQRQFTLLGERSRIENIA